MASKRIETRPLGAHDVSYVRNASRNVRSISVCAARVQSMPNSAKFAGVQNGTDRLPAGEECGEPDDADEAEGDTVAVRLRGTAAATRPGFRRGRVEFGACHSVVYSIG